MSKLYSVEVRGQRVPIREYSFLDNPRTPASIRVGVNNVKCGQGKEKEGVSAVWALPCLCDVLVVVRPTDHAASLQRALPGPPCVVSATSHCRPAVPRLHHRDIPAPLTPLLPSTVAAPCIFGISPPIPPPPFRKTRWPLSAQHLWREAGCKQPNTVPG